jgi:predicted SnoaL-like aldol condensation-catalyzing enzyme
MKLKPMNHKDAALMFLGLITTGDVEKAFELTVAPTFKHHNPFHKGDAASLRKGMGDAWIQFKQMKWSLKHIVEEGDLVAVHGKLILKPGEMEMTVVHLFRFDDAKIVELWDIGQQLPATSPNENGAF